MQRGLTSKAIDTQREAEFNPQNQSRPSEPTRSESKCRGVSQPSPSNNQARSLSQGQSANRSQRVAEVMAMTYLSLTFTLFGFGLFSDPFLDPVLAKPKSLADKSKFGSFCWIQAAGSERAALRFTMFQDNLYRAGEGGCPRPCSGGLPEDPLHFPKSVLTRKTRGTLREGGGLLAKVPQQLVPFYRFFFGWEGSPTKTDYRKNGSLILSSLLEDLVVFQGRGEGGAAKW